LIFSSERLMTKDSGELYLLKLPSYLPYEAINVGISSVTL